MQGFSLLEILVTLLIVTFGLLGAAGLQMRALHTGQGNQFRTQAILLTSDLGERMEANKAQAFADGYLIAKTSTAVAPADACYPHGCTDAAALAQADISNWENAIVNSTPPLPNPSWSVVRAPDSNGNHVYTITINWIDRRTDATYSDNNVGELVSYTATKTLYAAE